MKPELVSIASGSLHATVSSLGAELARLHTTSGVELLWDGNPAVWAGRSPLLFPIVGAVKGDRIKVNGRSYPLLRHGFARTSTFALVDARPSRCTWRLEDSDETRGRYPFAFRLDVTYAVAGDQLTIEALCINKGSTPMPASFGFHPAFRWPLVRGQPRDRQIVRFEKPEPAPLRRLDGNLLGSAVPSPVQGDRLTLSDALFEHDALIWDRLESRRLTYGGPDGPKLDLAFRDMPHLGIWTKPGAGFICLEPWQGFASPFDFDGELSEKPGIVEISPDSPRIFELSVTVR